MNRGTIKRLGEQVGKIEAALGLRGQREHVFYGGEEADEDRLTAELIADGRADENDLFIFIQTFAPDRPASECELLHSKALAQPQVGPKRIRFVTIYEEPPDA